MSLILDALRKSEQERGAGSTGLLQARVVATRQGLPWWALVLAGVLLLNLGLLAWLLWRPTPPAAAAAGNPTAQVAVAAPTAPAATAMPPGPDAPPAQAPTEAAYRPDESLPEATAADLAPAVEDLQLASGAARPPGRPLPRASTAPGPGLPTVEQGNAGGAGIPPLQLSLHIHAAQAAQRIVMINGLRLREGESTPEGVRIDHITEDGIVLGWRGRQFSLSRGD